MRWFTLWVSSFPGLFTSLLQDATMAIGYQAHSRNSTFYRNDVGMSFGHYTGQTISLTCWGNFAVSFAFCDIVVCLLLVLCKF